MSALPLAIVVGSTASELPVTLSFVIRTLAAGFVVTAVLLVVSSLTGWSLAARAMWLSVANGFWITYAPVGAAVQVIADIGPKKPSFASAYMLLAVLGAACIVRPWKVKSRDPVPLLMFPAIFLAINLARGFAFAYPASWRPAADTLIQSVLVEAASKSVAGPASNPQPAPARSVFYIVLDGFGRDDTLHRYYDLDLSRFVTFLRTRGFYVADEAQSNYSQTYLALASTLNLSYLDDIITAVGAEQANRGPMAYLISANALTRLARRAGYLVIGIGSDYIATRHFDSVDVCLCEQYGFDEFQQSAVTLTPLGPLLGKRPYDAHRGKVIASFDDIESVRSRPGRKFVFAHIVSPHPPFVFGPDGSPRAGDTAADIFSDGDDFKGTPSDYVLGYRNQTQFLVRRLMMLVDSLLKGPGPAPVIVLQGDHGPGSMLRWQDPGGSNMTERMAILAAYYFPDGPALYPTITPINGARALARGYLGAALPFLPDRSAFSTWTHPYALVPVSQLPRLD